MNPAQEEELMAKIASMGKDMAQLSAEIKMIKSESKELVKSVNNTTDNKTIKDDNVMDTNDTLGLAALLKNDDKGADSMAAMWNNPLN